MHCIINIINRTSGSVDTPLSTLISFSRCFFLLLLLLNSCSRRPRRSLANSESPNSARSVSSVAWGSLVDNP